MTQTPDYGIPATACVLQDRLGLSKDCLVFDVNLGCSGFTYGLNIVASLLKIVMQKRHFCCVVIPLLKKKEVVLK